MQEFTKFFFIFIFIGLLCEKCIDYSPSSSIESSETYNLDSSPSESENHDTDYSPPSSFESSEKIKSDIDIKPAVHPLPPSNRNYKFTVVTGASRNHFCPMKSFLYN